MQFGCKGVRREWDGGWMNGKEERGRVGVEGLALVVKNEPKHSCNHID